MKTGDLQIGDWVRLAYNKDKRYIKVICIYQNTIDTDYEGESLHGRYSDFEIEPILITKEILEKNGITESIIDGVFYEGISGRSITRQDDFYYMDGIIAVELRYVHELQHALRLLKIDKDIEL